MENIYKSKFIAVLFLLITTTAFAQIPNPGFETWTSGSCDLGINTYNDPTGWGSINVLTCPGGGFTCDEVNAGANVHSGSHALELATISIFGQLAPGIIATGVINQTTQNVDGGFALTTRPDKLIGWYKYLPANPDTFSVSIDIFSGLTTGTVIGTGSISGYSTVSTYTKFIVDIPYTSAATPDSAKITILSSPGQNGTAGTQMYVDDLAFVYCAGFAAAPTTVNANCTQASGSVTLATPVNGTAPYVYAWSNGSTASSLSSLVPGTYKVTITDNNTCTATDSVVVGAINTPFTVTPTNGTTSCNSNTGVVSVSASAGATPYTYLWSNTSTANSVTGLGAGNYLVTVTDNNGCTTSASASVATPNGPTAVDTVTNIKCYNDSSVSAVAVTVTGGTAPITYAWSNGTTTLSLTGVGAGTYTLTISDHNSCSYQVTATVTQPPALSLTGNATNILCHGGSTGTVSINATGGVQPYIYSWNTGSDTTYISGLPAGTYVATLVDSNLCTDSVSLSVTQPTAISLLFTTTNASSSTASDGAIVATATGGTGTLTYSWVTGATADSISHLSTGPYCLTVTDANFCTASGCDSVGYSQGTNGITVVSSVSFKVYPNPASSQLTIESSSTDGKFEFNLYSLDGRLVEQTIVAGEKSIVLLNKLADGFYTYQLKDAVSGAINYGKLQIQR